MDISLDKVCKRYKSGWILKDISCQIKSEQIIAITGPNGSGKSTLLQIIAGYLTHTKGEVTYVQEGDKIKRDNIYKFCSIAAAYSELDEELTVEEIFSHYQKFKPFLVSEVSSFLKLSDLEKERKKQIRTFSSGMKQRLSLALAFCMDVPLLLVDEPTSFLDASKKEWYHNLLQEFGKRKTIIIASNDPLDYERADQIISLSA